MFRRAGNCTRCDIAEGEDRRSKGFGSLQFDTPMEALTAVSMFNGMELGRGKRSMVVRLVGGQHINLKFVIILC